MGQVRFENFDFLVKVKGPPSQSIFSLSFFFFFGRRFGPGQVSRSVWVKPGLGDDVIHDVMELSALVRAWHVTARERVAST